MTGAVHGETHIKHLAQPTARKTKKIGIHNSAFKKAVSERDATYARESGSATKDNHGKYDGED